MKIIDYYLGSIHKLNKYLNYIKQEVLIEGEFKFVLIKGKIQILGYSISSNQNNFEFFSLKPHPLLPIKIAKSQQSHYLSLNQFKKTLQYFVQNQSFSNQLDIMYQHYEQCNAMLICQVMPEHPFQIVSVRNKKVKQSFTEQISNQIAWTPSHQNTVKLLSEKKNSQIMMVCGEKNTGKTQFCIYLLNYLLSNKANEVMFLDLDTGSSTLYIPGTISLFILKKEEAILSNLSNIHLKTPLQSYFLGEFQPNYNLTLYFLSLQKIMALYHSIYSHLHLVINTHGFLANIGELILFDQIKLIQPTQIIYLRSNDKLQFPENIQNRISLNQLQRQYQPQLYQKFELNTITLPNNSKFQHNSYKQIRKQNQIFKYLLESNYNNEIQSNISQLFYYQPIKLLNCKSFLFVNLQHNKLSIINENQSIATIFIGTMVALLNTNTTHADQLLTIENLSQNCIGFGFIKDFNLETNEMFIVTPLPIEKFAQVQIILKSIEYDLQPKLFIENQHDQQLNQLQCYDIFDEISCNLQDFQEELPFSQLDDLTLIANGQYYQRVQQKKKN